MNSIVERIQVVDLRETDVIIVTCKRPISQTEIDSFVGELEESFPDHAVIAKDHTIELEFKKKGK